MTELMYLYFMFLANHYAAVIVCVWLGLAATMVICVLPESEDNE